MTLWYPVVLLLPDVPPAQVWATRSWSAWPNLTLVACLLSTRAMPSPCCRPAGLQAARWAVLWFVCFFKDQFESDAFSTLSVILAWGWGCVMDLQSQTHHEHVVCLALLLSCLLRSACVTTKFLWHTSPSPWRAPVPPAQTSCRSWWPTPSLAATTSPTVAERLGKCCLIMLRRWCCLGENMKCDAFKSEICHWSCIVAAVVPLKALPTWGCSCIKWPLWRGRS